MKNTRMVCVTILLACMTLSASSPGSTGTSLTCHVMVDATGQSEVHIITIDADNRSLTDNGTTWRDDAGEWPHPVPREGVWISDDFISWGNKTPEGTPTGEGFSVRRSDGLFISAKFGTAEQIKHGSCSFQNTGGVQ